MSISLKQKVQALAPTRFERALTVVSPEKAMTRMQARHSMLEFQWRAANPGTRRQGSGGRSQNATTQSPASQRDRVKLIWDARKAYRNMPVISCVVNRLADYVVPQVMYQSNTGDDELDTLYEAYWKKWATHSADMTGRTDLAGLLRVAFIQMLVDGDFFIHPVHTEDGYELQCIESDRVGHPDRAGGDIDPHKISGVHIDDAGRPLAYEVFDRDKNGMYSANKDGLIPAEQMLPLMSLETSDQLRGVTMFCRVLDQANDLYESFSMERGAAKWASSYAGIVYEKDARGPRGGPGAAEFDGVTAEGTPTQEVQANKLLRLSSGESVEAFPPSNRPSGAFIALIDATIRDIAMGVDLPFGFFDMRGFGGASSRLEAHQIQRKINNWQNLLRRAVLNPLRDMVFFKAVQLGHLPPAPDMSNGSWTFGPHITADLGYQTNADITLLRYNLTSAAKLAAAQGYDYDELVDARAKEIGKLHAAAIKYQVPVEMLSPEFQNGTSLFADLAAAQNPEPKLKPTIQQAGDKVAKQILELINNVAEGALPREEAIELLVYTYQMPRGKAEIIVPKQGDADVPTAPTPQIQPNQS
jgi:capsid protein